MNRPHPPLKLKRNLILWGSLIMTGLFAYGFGLYQGSWYRVQRSMASIQEASPTPISSPDVTTAKTDPESSSIR